MPYRRKFKKRPYKKRYVKKKYAKKRTFGNTGIARISTPFPYKLVTKLRYHENNNLTPAALTYSYNYNINSLFDPNRTGTGHQPMYYDQLCPAVYQRYRVKGFSYKLVISDANTPIKFQAHFQNNNHSADYEDLGEMIGTKQVIVNSMANGGRCIAHLKGYTTIKRILGENLNDDRDQAAYNASPSNVALLGLNVTSLNGITNITTFNLDLTFTYYCELFDRIVTGGS
jgi:hypothetical protein